MSRDQPNLEYISVMLSDVLSDLGINNEMIQKRRIVASLYESGHCVFSLLSGHTYRMLSFGSQSEGSTTCGINSNNDVLYCLKMYHVIQDLTDWKPGISNVLMIQDDTTAPGHCFLQLVRDDVPLEATVAPDESFYKDEKGRVLLKNTLFNEDFANYDLQRHGPVLASRKGQGFRDSDVVFAYHCDSWPVEGRRWLNRRSRSGWPSAQLKSKSESCGCFLFPVGSKVTDLDDLEWRISTNLAEKHLMYSLNTTQIGCYVLMKMLIKSHDRLGNVISSYMCKTALFHSIENTYSDFWQATNLLLCLNKTLQILYNFIYYKNCPHFIIPENNLIAGRISPEQRHSCLEAVRHIIGSNGKVLLEIQTDNVGERLHMKLNKVHIYPHHIPTAIHTQRVILSKLYLWLADFSCDYYCELALRNNEDPKDKLRQLLCYYIRCDQHYSRFSYLEKLACSYMVPLLCSMIGSQIASLYKTKYKSVPDIAFKWMKLGLNSDVSSGLLRLATVCYSTGDLHATETILCHVNQQYNRNVVTPVCACHTEGRHAVKEDFTNAADQVQITNLRQIFSYCVMFQRCEANIVPYEIRQEYERSRPGDIQFRRGILDDWMDLAVVDSLPYLFFLQYKTYDSLKNRRERTRALRELQQRAHGDRLLKHKETALNLLGQCLEKENRPDDAFHCYERSLQIRPRNNAANFHMSRLLGSRGRGPVVSALD